MPPTVTAAMTSANSSLTPTVASSNLKTVPCNGPCVTHPTFHISVASAAGHAPKHTPTTLTFESGKVPGTGRSLELTTILELSVRVLTAASLAR